MRSAPAILIVAILASSSRAGDYYVATNGLDTNPGTLAQPFRTIQKAADVLQPGDQAWVRGGTYRETITARRSGTADAPIRFQAYQGERVTITGLDLVTGWSVHSGDIYRSSASGATNQVFVNGKPMLEARWPNPGQNNPLRAAFASVDSATVRDASQASTLTDNGLVAPTDGYWNGAKMAIISGSEWVAWNTTIDSQAGKTLSFRWTASTSTSYAPKSGNRYYLYGTLAALDTQKEWYYDARAGQLYLYAPGGADPNGQTVEARTRQYAFDLGSQSHLEISGFQMVAASVRAAGNHNLVDNCQILYPRAFTDPNGWQNPAGVEFKGQYNTLRHSEVAYSWGDAVTLTNSFNTVENNLLHDVAWSGAEGSFVYTSNSGNNTIRGNTMYNAGRSGVLHRGVTPNTLIEHNDISSFGYLTKDLGGTYCWGATGDGSLIAYNRVHDNRSAHLGEGIYLDNNSSGITVHHNLVWNVGTGIRLNTTAIDQNTYNNTLWNVNQAMSTWGPAGTYIENCPTYNNLSNNGTWIGSDRRNNLATSSDPFINAAAGDFRLRSGTTPVDYGRVIPGITDGYLGPAPDVGAFEQGLPSWTAGADWHSWLFADQVSVPLEAALYVQANGARVDTGSLVAGNPTSTPGNDSRVFLQFDLSALAGLPIRDAVLRLYFEEGAGNQYGDATLHPVLAAWTASTVGYDQPVGNGLAGFYDPANLLFYTDVDVTSLVRDWIANPATSFGFALRGVEGYTSTAKYLGGPYSVTPPQLLVTLDLPAVPEPRSLLLAVSAGAAGIGLLVVRKRRAAAVSR